MVIAESAWYDSRHGEFAHTSAIAAAIRRRIPPVVSLVTQSESRVRKLLGSVSFVFIALLIVPHSQRPWDQILLDGFCFAVAVGL